MRTPEIIVCNQLAMINRAALQSLAATDKGVMMVLG
jgi:hypothetical protein